MKIFKTVPNFVLPKGLIFALLKGTMSISAIDIFLTVVLLASLVYGLIRGIIKQIASLGGIVLGIIACRLFGGQVSALLQRLMPTTFPTVTAADVVGYVLLFLLVFFTVGAIASLVKKLTHALLLGWLDHLLGGLFSMFKWLLIVSILLNIWHFISPSSSVFSSSTLMDGELLPFVMSLAPRLLGMATGSEIDIANIPDSGLL